MHPSTRPTRPRTRHAVRARPPAPARALALALALAPVLALALGAMAAAACASAPPAASSPSAGAARPSGDIQAILDRSDRDSQAGRFAEAEAALAPSLRRTGLSAADRGRLLLQLGRVRARMIWFWDLRPDLSALPLQESLALAERAGDPDLLAEALDAVTMHAYTQLLFRGDGAWPPVEAGFARAVGLARSPSLRSRIRFHIGLTHQMQGRVDAAAREFAASLAEARAAGDEDTASQDLRHLAWVASVSGDRDRALSLFEESLLLRKRIGDGPGIATGHLAIAALEIESGRDAAARAHLAPADEIAARLGLGYPQVEAAVGLARLELRAGRARAAEPLASRALRVARSRTDDGSLGRALLVGAEVDAALGRTDLARAQLDEAKRVAGRAGDPDLDREVEQVRTRIAR